MHSTNTDNVCRDIIECIDKKASLSRDYLPFSSAMHGLLFMLVHSPRPIVGSLSYLIIDLSPLSFPLLIIIRRNKSQVYLIHVQKNGPMSA